jgi:hypothetical protein
LLQRVRSERKGHVVQLNQEASEDDAKRAVWTENSLGYARDHGQRRLVHLLEAVKADFEFEGTMRRGGGAPRPSMNVHWKDAPLDDGGTETEDEKRKRELEEETRKRELEEKKIRARRAVWERFMDAERYEIDMRKRGQLGRLLGEPLPGEPPAVLERLAEEDRRQAEDGLVALMSVGKVYYKHLDELCPEDMPARTAAIRLRTTWLKERGDVWLPREKHQGGGSL